MSICHFKRYRLHYTALALICTCLLLYLSACQNGAAPGQFATNGLLQNGTPGVTEQQTTSPNGSISLLVPRQGGTPGVSVVQPGKKTPTPSTTSTPLPTPTIPATYPPPPYPYPPGTTPPPGPSGPGSIPAAFPLYFSFGVMNPPGSAPALDSMRSSNGAAFAFRYQYLTGGANTGRGWETWQKPTGQFASYYTQESNQHGYVPTFVYYELCLSNGPHPSDYCSAHNGDQDTANLASPSTMAAYYANWVLLLQKIGAFGKPTLVIVEPDLWGFLQNASNGTDNAASVPAAVSSSGFADAAGFPDTAQGFSWALLHMRDKYAPNAILTIHASTWAAGVDIATDTRDNLDIAGIAQKEANFLNSAGLYSNPAGVSSWDLLSNDVADFDSGQPGGRSWWDRSNQTFPNFSRYLTFIGDLSQDTQRRVVLWQVPIGNQYFDTMNNSPGHYQDNRAEYILGNVSSFAAAGVITVLFGPGNGGTQNIDTMHDGITNPAPINTYECNLCNNHQSMYSDDDGGYLRIFVGLYMQHPVGIS